MKVKTPRKSICKGGIGVGITNMSNFPSVNDIDAKTLANTRYLVALGLFMIIFPLFSKDLLIEIGYLTIL